MIKFFKGRRKPPSEKGIEKMQAEYRKSYENMAEKAQTTDTDSWEFYTDAKGRHRWRCWAINGNILAAAHECYGTADQVKKNAQRHGYEGNPEGLGLNDNWEFFIDAKGEHRWKRTAPNGEPVGRSTEGYTTLKNCLSNAKRNGWVGEG